MKNSNIWATFTAILLFLVAGFLVPSQASNNRVQIAQQPNCKSPQTTVDMNICSSQEFKAADTKLNQLYQQILPKINSKQKQRLIAAQRTWVKFRDETCDYSAGHFEGGTLAAPIYVSCKAKVTQDRVKDFEGYLEQANL
ncbi:MULTISPECIES: lysozyme inhibitor LprI family protein [unclassified Microcoleus]|uniref:lysozyme inhibitor LprI family protein n=1 Tax=unclassified Microcoleus TaxID=2642155 RepID=UPI002FD3670A